MCGGVQASVLAYVCIYIAIAAAWVFSIGTYFANSMSGWYAETFEGTLEISLTCLCIFAIFTTICNTCAALARPGGMRVIFSSHVLRIGEGAPLPGHGMALLRACMLRRFMMYRLGVSSLPQSAWLNISAP